MMEIELTKGYKTIISSQMHLADMKWRAVGDRPGHMYACRWSTYINGKRELIRLHREIIGAKPGEQVDHINGDSLDNRIENLRICTASENNSNRGNQKNNTSGFRGVTWNKQTQKFRACIWSDRKRFYLGSFDDPIEAAKAYDRKADELHGEFARLNFAL